MVKPDFNLFVTRNFYLPEALGDNAATSWRGQLTKLRLVSSLGPWEVSSAIYGRADRFLSSKRARIPRTITVETLLFKSTMCEQKI